MLGWHVGHESELLRWRCCNGRVMSRHYARYLGLKRQEGFYPKLKMSQGVTSHVRVRLGDPLSKRLMKPLWLIRGETKKISASDSFKVLV